jgi:hypothetical protein
MKSRKFLLFALRLAVVAALASVSTLPLAAQGARDQLKGTYSFTGDQSCLVSSLGFNPNLTPTTGSVVTVQSASTQGIFRFKADGTGTAQFKELLIGHPPASLLFASSLEASFSFTYTVADDGALTLVPGLVNGTFSTGPFAGLTVTNNPPPLIGRIARNGAAITLTTTDPTVESSTLGPPANAVFPRICHRMRVLIPVHVDREH